MRKLPSSASAGNLRQLVDSASEVAIYSSHGPSLVMPSGSRNNDGMVLNKRASSTNVANIVAATSLNANMATSVATAEDRSSKKSLAYRHTMFHEVMTDDFGKSYERRTCKYCGAVFSFKGGTTSAALRHLKTTHPETIASKGAPTTTPSTPQSVETHESQSVDGGNRVHHLTGTGARVAATLTSTTVNDIPRRDSSHVSAVEAPSQRTLQRGSSAVSLASSTASEDDDRSFSTPKRRRGGEEKRPTTSGSVNSGDTPNGGGAKVCKTMGPETSKLTASQEAIVHFLHHYAKELPQPAMRLRFAKHLTHNVAEAQMYNVLDPATQLEYVREFARSPATN